MKFLAFEIRNFRGIEKAKIDLVPSGSGVFTLIGLNESGKTTILEAISSFRLGEGDEKPLYQATPIDEDPATFVPKHEKYNFTGEVTVTATVAFEEGDKDICASWAEGKSGWKIDRSTIPDTFRIKRGHSFENSDNTGSLNSWYLDFTAKPPSARKYRDVEAEDEVWKYFSAMIRAKLPDITYFPTFIFDQPEKIVLNPTDGEGGVDKLYRTIVENVGASLPKPIDIKTHIVDRIIEPETPLEQFAGLFGLSQSKQQQVDSAVDQLSHRLTETVFDSWSKIFGTGFSDREVRLKLGVDKHEDGSPRIYLQIGLKDGRQQYDISERSLGFRWFFSFLLFTLFKNRERGVRNTLFLLDEPASNLHSSAQTQLMDSFPRITGGGNMLMYSTHSHYLINPEWLDQAFIVSNSAVDYDDVSGARASSGKTEVHVQKYRTFVGSNPDKVTYFQPVLDKLQVIPSRLDAVQPSVLLEGKGDYLLLRYALLVAMEAPIPYALVPTRGADHFGELVGILLGWGVNTCLCFDDDAKGRAARQEYADHWAFGERAFTLKDVDETLAGKAVEGLLEESDLAQIASHYGIERRKLTKSQIQLFFSEKLALKEKVAFSSQYLERAAKFDAVVKRVLGLS